VPIPRKARFSKYRLFPGGISRNFENKTLVARWGVHSKFEGILGYFLLKPIQKRGIQIHIKSLPRSIVTNDFSLSNFFFVKTQLFTPFALSLSNSVMISVFLCLCLFVSVSQG